MKSMRQLFRQPMRTLAGILLVTLAVAILITCVGQYAAASVTRAELDRQHDTVALITDAYQELSRNKRKEWWSWYDNLVENHIVGDRDDIIKEISHTGLLSAYIPEMNPDNYTKYHEWSNTNYGTDSLGRPYCCTVLVVNLEEIGTDITETKMDINTSAGDHFEITRFVSVSCRGTVEQVVALDAGFNSPEGWTINLTVRASDEAALEAMDLKAGQRYLVYGMDYMDDDWLFRQHISEDEWNFAQPFDMSKVYEDHPLGPDHEWSDNGWEWNYYENTVKGKKVYVGFDADNLLTQLRNCSLTVCDYASLPHITAIHDENNTIAGFAAHEKQRVLMEDEYSSLLDQYGTTMISKEAYMQMYSVPTMTKLVGSVDDFLNSADGELWRAVLESTEINNHAFPVLAVDKLGYQAEFAREYARIVQGRDFTQDELENGEKVCILSESQAVVNGLAVGDTISIQTYYYDPNITEHALISRYPNAASPFASFYSRARGFSSEPESYTIVGLYRLSNERGGTSNYGFTSSTIFIPKKATDAKMVTWDEGVFRSIILHNGKLDDFNAILAEAGFEHTFIVYDKGYNDLLVSLNAYETVSSRALYVGVGAWLVMLCLFVLLFPLRQREALATMRSLGAGKSSRFRHVLSSALGLLIPGTVLGWAAGTRLWDMLSAELMETVGVSVPLASDGTGMLLAAGVQLLIALAVICVTALAMIREKGGKT